MKKAFPVLGIVLFCGVLLGVLSFPIFHEKETPVRSTMRAAEGAADQAVMQLVSAPPSEPAAALMAETKILDQSDDVLLLECAGKVLDALAVQDYAALSRLVHPIYGVTFTPYSTVDPENDLCFMPDQIAQAGHDTQTYLWGFTDGKGEHINLTMAEYFKRYVYNADYRSAPQMAVDEVIASGNALENVQNIFSRSRFVEYHFPGLDPANQGLDWCSLKVVLFPYGEQWRLVALVHSEWTI